MHALQPYLAEVLNTIFYFHHCHHSEDSGGKRSSLKSLLIIFATDINYYVYNTCNINTDLYLSGTPPRKGSSKAISYWTDDDSSPNLKKILYTILENHDKT